MHEKPLSISPSSSLLQTFHHKRALTGCGRKTKLHVAQDTSFTATKLNSLHSVSKSTHAPNAPSTLQACSARVRTKKRAISRCSGGGFTFQIIFRDLGKYISNRKLEKCKFYILLSFFLVVSSNSLVMFFSFFPCISYIFLNK